MMLNLATNYKNGNNNLDCPLCEEAEDTLRHSMTRCRKYSHLASSFYTDDLFSSETVNILKATIAIKDRMQIRAQLLAIQWASRNWRRETRMKEILMYHQYILLMHRLSGFRHLLCQVATKPWLWLLVRFSAGVLWSVLGQDSLFRIASVYPYCKMGT